MNFLRKEGMKDEPLVGIPTFLVRMRNFPRRGFGLC